YESTVNRDHLRALIESAPPEVRTPDTPDVDELNLGISGDLITTTVDVRDFVEQKRSAMRAHASQIPPESFFLMMPDDVFREWFVRRGVPTTFREDTLFAD